MRSPTISPGQDEIIKKFLEHLGIKDIQSQPDRLNRATPDIDAIAGKLAIEHTSIDSIGGQRKNNAKLLEAYPDEEILNAPVDFFATISIPWDSLTTAKNLASLKSELEDFIKNELSFLRFGRHVAILKYNNIKISISKRNDLKPSIHIARIAEKDHSLSIRVANQIKRKAEKLKQYKEKGKTTILLLEVEDIALMNSGIMLEAIINGFSQDKIPDSLDQIWYVDTTIQGAIKFINFSEYLINL